MSPTANRLKAHASGCIPSVFCRLGACNPKRKNKVNLTCLPSCSFASTLFLPFVHVLRPPIIRSPEQWASATGSSSGNSEALSELDQWRFFLSESCPRPASHSHFVKALMPSKFSRGSFHIYGLLKKKKEEEKNAWLIFNLLTYGTAAFMRQHLNVLAMCDASNCLPPQVTLTHIQPDKLTIIRLIDQSACRTARACFPFLFG